MTLDDVKAFIQSQDLDYKDLDSLVRAVDVARTDLQRRKIVGIGLGDTVSFIASNGEIREGQVWKIGRKYLRVFGPSGFCAVPGDRIIAVQNPKG